MIEVLNTLTTYDVAKFTLCGEYVLAKVCEIYDGDTCKIIFMLPGSGRIIKRVCRLEGIDAPEIKPLLKITNREIMIEKAKLARERLSGLITNCPSWTKTCEGNTLLIGISLGDFDKYGRILGTFDGNVKEILIDEGLCKPYDGGKKDTSWN